MYSKDNNKENSSYGISVNTSVSDDKKIHAVLYYDINYLDKTDKASDYELKDIWRILTRTRDMAIAMVIIIHYMKLIYILYKMMIVNLTQ